MRGGAVRTLSLGKGDYKFSREGLGRVFSRIWTQNSSLSDGLDLLFEDALGQCARELRHLRDLFAKVAEAGGSVTVFGRRPARSEDRGVHGFRPAEHGGVEALAASDPHWTLPLS